MRTKYGAPFGMKLRPFWRARNERNSWRLRYHEIDADGAQFIESRGGANDATRFNAMNVDPGVLAMIVVMASITALSRVAGYWLSGRIEISERIETAMNLIPGTILTALIAPAVVTEGVGGLLAAGGAVLVMRKTGNLLITLAFGLGVLILYRSVT